MTVVEAAARVAGLNHHEGHTLGLFGKAKNKLGKAKDSTDDRVEANSDKIPDGIEN